MNEELICEKCNSAIADEEDCFEYHSTIFCENCLFRIFLKEHNFDKRLTQDDLNDDDYFIWDRFRENHLF